MSTGPDGSREAPAWDTLFLYSFRPSPDPSGGPAFAELVTRANRSMSVAVPLQADVERPLLAVHFPSGGDPVTVQYETTERGEPPFPFDVPAFLLHRAAGGSRDLMGALSGFLRAETPSLHRRDFQPYACELVRLPPGDAADQLRRLPEAHRRLIAQGASAPPPPGPFDPEEEAFLLVVGLLGVPFVSDETRRRAFGAACGAPAGPGAWNALCERHRPLLFAGCRFVEAWPHPDTFWAGCPANNLSEIFCFRTRSLADAVLAGLTGGRTRGDALEPRIRAVLAALLETPPSEEYACRDIFVPPAIETAFHYLFGGEGHAFQIGTVGGADRPAAAPGPGARGASGLAAFRTDARVRESVARLEGHPNTYVRNAVAKHALSRCGLEPAWFRDWVFREGFLCGSNPDPRNGEAARTVIRSADLFYDSFDRESRIRWFETLDRLAVASENWLIRRDIARLVLRKLPELLQGDTFPEFCEWIDLRETLKCLACDPDERVALELALSFDAGLLGRHRERFQDIRGILEKRTEEQIRQALAGKYDPTDWY
jgi:hypothetical protein